MEKGRNPEGDLMASDKHEPRLTIAINDSTKSSQAIPDAPRMIDQMGDTGGELFSLIQDFKKSPPSHRFLLKAIQASFSMLS